MARNNAVARRRKAGFLCLQFGLIACFAAIMAMVYLAWPVKLVNAQSMCVNAERFAVILSEQETVTDVFILGHEGTGLYLEAVTGMQAPQDANAIVFIAGGEAALVPVVGDLACAEYGVIPIDAQAHARGMQAVYGSPT
jgi:hypothetical protein